VYTGVQPLARLVARPSASTLRLAHTRSSLASVLPKSGFQARIPGFCQGCAALQMRAGFQTSAAATAEPVVEEAEGETHEYQAEVCFLSFSTLLLPSAPPLPPFLPHPYRKEEGRIQSSGSQRSVFEGEAHV